MNFVWASVEAAHRTGIAVVIAKIKVGREPFDRLRPNGDLLYATKAANGRRGVAGAGAGAAV